MNIPYAMDIGFIEYFSIGEYKMLQQDLTNVLIEKSRYLSLVVKNRIPRDKEKLASLNKRIKDLQSKGDNYGIKD